MRTVAVLINGEIFGPNGMRLNDARPGETRAIAPAPVRETKPMPINPVDEITALLARAVKLAQELPASDQRRVRAFFEASRSLLQATTFLETTDQQRFEMALLSAAKR